jgi:tRNA synthetases class I (E and Q), anti-codon binding domain
LPKHKKNADVGEKKTVYTSNILIDQEDALSFDDNEEVRSSFFYAGNPPMNENRSPSWTGEMPSCAPRLPTAPGR